MDGVSDVNIWNTVIQIASVVGTLSTIILGIVAIWLSLYFYRRSNELNNSVRNLLSEIKESSRVTETTSRDLLNPTVRTILDIVQNRTRTSIESEGYIFMQRSAAKLDQVLKAQTVEEKEAARRAFIDEVNSLLGRLRHEVGKVGLALEPESGPVVNQPTPIKPTLPLPGSPSYNWIPFIRKIRDMEANPNRKFLSVRWLRETIFSRDPEAQEALQIAIDRLMLSTYYQDNTKNPKFPTLCCKLNQDHPVVNQILQAIDRK